MVAMLEMEVEDREKQILAGSLEVTMQGKSALLVLLTWLLILPGLQQHPHSALLVAPECQHRL